MYSARVHSTKVLLILWIWTCWKQHPSWLLQCLVVRLLSLLSVILIAILSMLVLYPAVFIYTVCHVWFDPQALVLTAAKKNSNGKTPPSLFPTSYFLLQTVPGTLLAAFLQVTLNLLIAWLASLIARVLFQPHPLWPMRLIHSLTHANMSVLLSRRLRCRWCQRKWGSHHYQSGTS